MTKILIAGCGKIGTHLGLRLCKTGHQVWGIRHSAQALPAPINTIQADLSNLNTLGELPDKIDYVFYTAAARGFSDKAYEDAYVTGLKNILQRLHDDKQKIKRVFFTSSTAVYGQVDGGWVDEDTFCEPQNFSGSRMLEAEQLLSTDVYPSTIIRCGGIYGFDRTRLVEQVRTGSAMLSKNSIYTNRIHSEDVVGVLEYMMFQPDPLELYLAVDSEPVLRNDFILWLADKLGAPAPKMSHDEVSGPQRGNKRCSNKRLLASGYMFRYPSYKDGYADL